MRNQHWPACSRAWNRRIALSSVFFERFAISDATTARSEAVGWKEYTAMGADNDNRLSLFDDNEEIGMYYFPFIVQQHYVAFNDE